MVNISTDIWDSEISETCEMKQTLRQCCLKSSFDTKTNSWWSNWYKILVTNNRHRYFSLISYHKYLSQSLLALQVCYKYYMR